MRFVCGGLQKTGQGRKAGSLSPGWAYGAPKYRRQLPLYERGKKTKIITGGEACGDEVRMI